MTKVDREIYVSCDDDGTPVCMIGGYTADIEADGVKVVRYVPAVEFKSQEASWGEPAAPKMAYPARKTGALRDEHLIAAYQHDLLCLLEVAIRRLHSLDRTSSVNEILRKLDESRGAAR